MAADWRGNPGTGGGGGGVRRRPGAGPASGYLLNSPTPPSSPNPGMITPGAPGVGPMPKGLEVRQRPGSGGRGGGGLGGPAGGGPVRPAPPPGGGGPGGPGGPGGGLGGPALGSPITPFDPLTVKASPSPEMGESIAAWKKRMADLEAGYKERMSSDPTQRAIDKAAGAIRSQAAGMGEAADAAGAAGGRGPGFGAAGIGDTAQMALAKASSDITLGREKDLDALFLGGQDAMNRAYGMNPFEDTARLGLDQTKLGLEAWLGMLDAETKRAIAKAEIEAKKYGSPMDWYQILMGMV